MSKPPYFGDPGFKEKLDQRAEELVDLKPNTDHVIRTWRKRGPDTALTWAAIDDICTLIAGGVPMPIACAARGYGTKWQAWNKTAKEHYLAGIEPGFEPGQSPFLVWMEAVTEAKASCIVNLTLSWTGQKGDWKAARDFLQARYKEFQPVKQSTVTVKTEHEKAQELSTEELKRQLAADNDEE